jgi:hypothetical protein
MAPGRDVLQPCPERLRTGRLPACGPGRVPLYGRVQRGMQMATFNRVFTTQRLVQIIVVLGATVLMKLLA